MSDQKPLLTIVNEMTDEEVAALNAKLQKKLIIKMTIGAAAIVAGHFIAKALDKKLESM